MPHLDPEQKVILNVGGAIFESTVRILRSVPDSFFCKLLNEKWESLNRYEPIFIDRDPLYFGAILTFLEKGTTRVPTIKEDVEELRQEARFFLLDSLLQYITQVEHRGNEKSPFFIGDLVKWKDLNFSKNLLDLGYNGRKETLPLCFRKINVFAGHHAVCSLCGCSSSSFESGGPFKCLGEITLDRTMGNGVVKKVYGDFCCCDVAFGEEPRQTLVHTPSNMLKLVN